MQRKLSRKQKASRNRTKAKTRLARTHDLAGQELPQAPVDVMADILTHWGLLSASTINQEATAL